MLEGHLSVSVVMIAIAIAILSTFIILRVHVNGLFHDCTIARSDPLPLVRVSSVGSRRFFTRVKQRRSSRRISSSSTSLSRINAAFFLVGVDSALRLLAGEDQQESDHNPFPPPGRLLTPNNVSGKFVLADNLYSYEHERAKADRVHLLARIYCRPFHQER